MPGVKTTEVECEKCGHRFEATVIDHVDLAEDRDLLKKVKSGKVNRVQCPKCKKVMFLQRSIVINFEPENLIVLYDPAATDSQRREELERDYKTVVTYNEVLEEIGEEIDFRIISDLSELKKIVTAYEKNHT